MFQIIFNDLSAAEMARMPKELQLEILSEFHLLPEDFDPKHDSDRFGRLERDNRVYYRFRARDYRLYFRKTGQGLVIDRVLHKNTLKDFLFRTSLPVGEDEALENEPGFWKLLDEARK